MIKELIIDIAYDKITIGQALTRAKLIANQIKNEDFKNWLHKELNGYDYDEKNLPNYREIWAEIKLCAEFPNGQTHVFSVIVPDSFDKKIRDNINFHKVYESISIIEKNLCDFESSLGTINLPSSMVEILGNMYENVKKQRGVIRNGWRTVGKSQYQNIVELTKQKLLDTLQELENQFPEIDKTYIMNDENEKKVKNIITNNIYGNNNPLNLVSGSNITQGNISFNISKEQKEKLQSYGVESQDIQELETIDNENPKGSESRNAKILSWISKVSTSLVARGIYDNIPNVITFASSII